MNNFRIVERFIKYGIRSRLYLGIRCMIVGIYANNMVWYLFGEALHLIYSFFLPPRLVQKYFNVINITMSIGFTK